MKVLHLTTHLNPGGITNYIYRLVHPLRERGCELSVVSGGGSEIPTFEKLSVPLLTSSVRTKSELSPKLYLALCPVLRYLKQNQIDLLHAHTRVTQVLSFWIQRFHPVPVVTTCHGFYKRRLGRRLLPAWGDRAIAISQPVYDQLVNDFHVPSSRAVMINNGIDFEEIEKFYKPLNPSEEKRAFGFRGEHVVIGSVARLVPDKGHEFLIRAVAKLAKSHPQIRLLIVGDGPHRPFLESLARELGIAEETVFAGMTANDRVLRALAATDIFSLPATWREGFGLSIVEAMACQKPVIVTNIWSLNTLVDNRKTGILIEPKNVNELAEAIRELIQDTPLRLRIAAEGQKKATRLFSVGTMADKIHAVYRSVLSERLTPGQNNL